MMAPRDDVIIGVPHASVAIADPGAGTPVGLHPRSELGGQKVKHWRSHIFSPCEYLRTR
jgi:hypothetical protein